ncbi:Uncharacterized protein APZ42_030939 [Daphnia magna]|uniref:Reverse transcriptase domain-containing protein n=1 Tax=Daphnia magna TaxID=35525 RepID=A0A164NAB2_9CRUS|nr:Uncharacterized protein APZ42_030939 [Daphnia magna]
MICSQLDFDLYDVGEKKLHTLGIVTLPVGYGESILQQEFIITNGISVDCILGWDAIQKHAFKLDGETKSICLAKDGQGSSSVFGVLEMAGTTVKKMTLSRQTSLVIVGQLKGSFPYVSPNTAFLFTPVENLSTGVYIEEFIGKVSGDGMYNIVVENHSLNQVKIPRNTKLGVIEIIHYFIGKTALDQREAKHNEITEPMVISEVDTEFQAPLSKLLNDFYDLYKKLNGIRKKDSFSMPRIDDTLDKLYGIKFFTTLDLASGYWQIQVHDPNIEKTAFVVENNLYEFKRMAFGLCNAPATFQRLMNYVLKDILGSKALVYLDDVIIFLDTFENHLLDIREIFTLLKEANLKLKLNKCQFIKRSVNYLGHVISTHGIKPDPGEIDKIVNYKTPTSVDEVRSFLGLAGY